MNRALIATVAIVLALFVTCWWRHESVSVATHKATTGIPTRTADARTRPTLPRQGSSTDPLQAPTRTAEKVPDVHELVARAKYVEASRRESISLLFALATEESYAGLAELFRFLATDRSPSAVESRRAILSGFGGLPDAAEAERWLMELAADDIAGNGNLCGSIGIELVRAWGKDVQRITAARERLAMEGNPRIQQALASALIQTRSEGIQNDLENVYRASRDVRVRAQILMNQAALEDAARGVALLSEAVAASRDEQDPAGFEELMSVALVALGAMAHAHPEYADLVGSLLVTVALRIDIVDSVYRDAVRQLAVSHPIGLEELAMRLPPGSDRLQAVQHVQAKLEEGARIDAPFKPPTRGR
jgi:hypothetical protein